MTMIDDRLGLDVTHLALCWRIVRSDGVAIGFTTHDRPIAVNGIVHESVPGMTPSAVVATDSLEADTMEIAGVLSANAISDDDLKARRYDGAFVELFLVDWLLPDAGTVVLARGTLGNVEIGAAPDAGFTAGLRGETARFMATAIDSYSPECRAELGDLRCRVDMRGRRWRGIVAARVGDRVTGAGISAETVLFDEGRLRVLSGRYAGVDRRIVAIDGDSFVLDEALAVAPGDRIEAWQGCDKRFATCTGRFANGQNFRGEPHVPGADVLTRFGGF